MYRQHRYKRTDMALLELNHSFIASFHTFLLNNRKMKQNASVKSLRILKQVINVALADRHLPTDPFAKFKIQREVVERDSLMNEDVITTSFSCLANDVEGELLKVAIIPIVICSCDRMVTMDDGSEVIDWDGSYIAVEIRSDTIILREGWSR